MEAAENNSVKDQNTSTTSQSPSRSPQQNRLQQEESMEENLDLDFEEISEDELEEESRLKGIGDALGVDWASLVAESRPRIKPVSSAKRRWESHNVLANLGVSVNFTDEEFVKDILKQHARAEIAEQKKEEDVSVKKEPEEVNTNGIKEEIPDEPEEVKTENAVEVEDITVSHPLGAIQTWNRDQQTIRRTLFSSVGPFRRALSARRDLMIRRHLCNLPVNDSYVESPKRHDPELLRMATMLFERSL